MIKLKNNDLNYEVCSLRIKFVRKIDKIASSRQVQKEQNRGKVRSIRVEGHQRSRDLWKYNRRSVSGLTRDVRLVAFFEILFLESIYINLFRIQGFPQLRSPSVKRRATVDSRFLLLIGDARQ